MYKLRIFQKAKKALKRIPLRYQKAILDALKDLGEDPFLGKPLTRDLTGKFSYRVGVYRIIYGVRKKDKIVEVYNAGHRSRIYD